ncbi:DMT family transporter [Vibrio tapetis]|uniref:EamA domain-containing protein n=1 Tax=Vibrio tapetis subsp. tapetis TaxID=1671868 RepID=A0A2N8ZJ66_9VIBR|nr:DMT family transporter [Vibrio tapetis]SON51937.1 conserved membrane protein of unknown function [Vibrio tapetis subsp. tapetis]
MKNNSTINGQYLVLASAFFYGLNPFFAQLLFKEGIGAELVSLYRFILPAVLFIFFLRTPRQNWPEATRSLLLGLVSGIAIFSYFYALETVSAATVILIYYSYPFFSVLIGWAVFGRIPSQNSLVSAVLVAIAASLTVRPDYLPEGSLLAIGGCFLAPLTVATQVQYLSRPNTVIPTLNRMGWITMGHVAVLLPITIWNNPTQLLPQSSTGLMAMLGIALFAAAIPQFLFMVGAPRSCANKNAVTGSLELIVALLTGAILLGEELDRLELTAMALMLLALFIKQAKPVHIKQSTLDNS